MKKFEGIGLTQFNVSVEVKAKNKTQATKMIEKFFEDTQGWLDFKLRRQGKEVEVTFDECFEIIDVREKK